MPLKKKPNYNPNNYFQSCYSSVFHFLFIIALHLLVHCFIFSLACKLLAVQGNTSIFSVIKHAAVIFQSFNVTKSKCSFYCTLQITLNSNTSYSIPLLCCIYNVTVLPQIHKVLQPLFWRSLYVIWGQRQNVSCKALQGTQLSHSWPCVLFPLKGRTWDINHFPNVWSDVSLPVLKLAVSPSQNQVKDHLQNRAGHTSSSSLSQMKGTTTERISDLLELFCSCFSVYSYLVKNTNTVKLCMKSELRVFLSVKEIKRYQHPSWRLGVK